MEMDKRKMIKECWDTFQNIKKDFNPEKVVEQIIKLISEDPIENEALVFALQLHMWKLIFETNHEQEKIIKMLHKIYRMQIPDEWTDADEARLRA